MEKQVRRSDFDAITAQMNDDRWAFERAMAFPLRFPRGVTRTQIAAQITELARRGFPLPHEFVIADVDAALQHIGATISGRPVRIINTSPRHERLNGAINVPLPFDTEATG